MSLWHTITDTLHSMGTAGAELFDKTFEGWAEDEDTRRSVDFTVAIVALSAKMAKADGIVTDEEIHRFWSRFDFEPNDRRNIAWLFLIAQRDVRGFEIYAQHIADMFEKDPRTLADILDILFSIAAADGYVHEREELFLEEVAAIFGIEPVTYGQIEARYLATGPVDPYAVLGISREVSDSELKRQYHALVAEHHPDRLVARGMPPAFVRIANDRLASINAAFDQIRKQRRAAARA